MSTLPTLQLQKGKVLPPMGSRPWKGRWASCLHSSQRRATLPYLLFRSFGFPKGFQDRISWGLLNCYLFTGEMPLPSPNQVPSTEVKINQTHKWCQSGSQLDPESSIQHPLGFYLNGPFLSRLSHKSFYRLDAFLTNQQDFHGILGHFRLTFQNHVYFQRLVRDLKTSVRKSRYPAHWTSAHNGSRTSHSLSLYISMVCLFACLLGV